MTIVVHGENMKQKKVIEHRDIIGRKLNVNDYVCVCVNNTLRVAVVIKLTAKMAKIKILDAERNRWYTGEHYRYPSDLIVMGENEYLTMFLLKANG